ncbi:DUF6716 putative glycosyltransferase [Labrenzia sp. C1B70]|uniref:DUF6716 putative glycosyltransferase n=1 Tax=Labrenzia sp. C1B70 TaxID=1397531 RepID=UPI001378A5A7|nr:DUF6716 putative glycosyltransferase [Labrenzia sp. C1B70]
MLTAFDSHEKLAAALVHACPNTSEVNWFYSSSALNRMHDEQVAELHERRHFEKFDFEKSCFSSIASRHDVFIVSLPGRDVEKSISLIREIQYEQKFDQKIIVSGFAGLLYSNRYGALETRLGSDIICVNSENDYQDFRDYLIKSNRELYIDSLVRTGFVIADKSLSDNLNCEFSPDNKPHSILFAEQPDVPNAIYERQYVAEQLIALAEKNPDLNIVIKPRLKKGYATFHKSLKSIAEIIQQSIGPIPKNIKIDYSNINDLILNTDLVCSISSTAIVEGVLSGKFVACISDFGLREPYGTHAFVGSGFLTRIVNLTNLMEPNRNWIEMNCGFQSKPSEVVKQRIQNLLTNAPLNFPPLRLVDATYNPPLFNKRHEKDTYKKSRNLGSGSKLSWWTIKLSYLERQLEKLGKKYSKYLRNAK